MNAKIHTLLPLAAIAGLVLTGSAGATTVIANFTTNLKADGTAGATISTAYASGINFQNAPSTWAQNVAPTSGSFTFSYDISGLGIGLADELLITVATLAPAPNLNTASGNGIAVQGGFNNLHWDYNDPGLSFTIVVQDASNNDITSSLSIDLTGVGMRWGTSAAATFAGQSIAQSTTLQGVDLTTGQTAEASFTGLRTGAQSLTQVQQLRFEIVPEPSVALIGGLGVLGLLRRRRSA